MAEHATGTTASVTDPAAVRQDVEVEAAPFTEEEHYAVEEDLPPPARRWVPALFAAAAILWVVFFLWARVGRTAPPPLTDIPAFIAQATIPLLLIGLLYLIVQRSSYAETRRFGDAARVMRREAQQMEARIRMIAEDVEAAHVQLAAQADLVKDYGIQTSERLTAAASTLRNDVEAVGHQQRELDRIAAQLTRTLGTFETRLPALQERTTDLHHRLEDVLHGTTRHFDGMEKSADTAAKAADAARLRAQEAEEALEALRRKYESGFSDADSRLESAAEQATQLVARMLDEVDGANRSAQAALEAQGAHLSQEFETRRAALEVLGREQATQFSTRIAEIEASLRGADTMLRANSGIAAALIQDLDSGLQAIERDFARLDREGLVRTERLSSAVELLIAHVGRMQEQLSQGHTLADGMIGRSEALLLALDANTREIEETLPAALDRLDERVSGSQSRLAALRPELEHVELLGEALLGRIKECGDLIGAQGQALAGIGSDAEKALAARQEESRELSSALQELKTMTDELSDQSAPRLISAMLRVRETAKAAAERARDSLMAAIPDAAEAMGSATSDAIDAAIRTTLEERLKAVESLATRAITAATGAAQRLGEQVGTLTDRSQAIEQRLSDARDIDEARDRESFAQRSKLLIESLNSIAIDVTKILSNEVTDTAWASYLKGDRGVFTRRAVKLLDSGEVREVARHYDNDPEFRENVNRYIHDFETMLRGVLTTREGNNLGVTLLSADIGKLYVALAQAIERLRN